MIDTLKLRLDDYSISPGSALKIQPAAYSEESGEVDREIEIAPGLRCAKAYLNREWHLTIQPKIRGGAPRGSLPEAMAHIQFSIPKLSSPDLSNLSPVSESEARAVIDRVERELAQCGIRASLREAPISRVDLFRNIEAEENFSSYSPVFSLLTGSRLNRRELGSTFQWGNAQRQLITYDKREEIRARGAEVSGISDRLMRFEYRLLNSRKVQEAAGLKNCGALLDAFGDLPGLYRKAWGESVFKSDPKSAIQRFALEAIGEAMQIFRAREEARAAALRQRGIRAGSGQWIRSYLSAFGGYQLVRSIGAVQVGRVYAAELVSGGLPEASARRMGNRLSRKMEADFSLLTMNTKNIDRGTFGDLYQEIREKVLS